MGLAVVFPGQGTQAAGMLSQWRDHRAWALVGEAQDALDDPLDFLDDDSSEQSLLSTRATQIAVVVASLLAWEAVRENLPKPVAFAGHSLGQFSALVAAGCLSVGAGVRLVSARGAITERFARRTPGRMAALLGVSVEQATEACEAAPGDCWVANDNAPGQVVIAGSPGGMDAACDHARELGARRIVPLRISGAFHTPLLARASKMFGRTLATSSFTYPSAPVVSNEDARAYDDAQGWRDRLRRHLVTPVRWRESLNTMVKMGAQNLVELGPGTTLAGLARRSVPGVRVVSVSSPDDLPRLAQLSTR